MASNALPAAPPPSDIFAWTDDLKTLTAPPCNLAPHCQQPIPTNAWWASLHAWPHDGVDKVSSCMPWCPKSTETIKPRSDSKPIFSNPYTYRIAGDRGLAVSYLFPYRVEAPVNPADGTLPYYYFPATDKHVVLSADEWIPSPSPQSLAMELSNWDDLGVHVTLHARNASPSSFASTYLTQGNAFTTVQYHQLHARLESTATIVSVNGNAVRDGLVMESDDTAFVVHFDNGQTWIAFLFADGTSATGRNTSTPMQLKCAGQQHALVTPTTFSGVVQVAFVACTKPANSLLTADQNAIIQVYRKFAGCFATHAKVFVDDNDTDAGTYGFTWRLQHVKNQYGREDDGDVQYLHFVLSHLHETMDKDMAVLEPNLQLCSQTRGPMYAYSVRKSPNGKFQWRFQPAASLRDAVEKQATSFFPIHPNVSRTVVQDLHLESLITEELALDWHDVVNKQSGYYFKGKALQKLGTVCLVAWQLAQTTSPQLLETAKAGIAAFHAVMEAFVANSSAHPLVYDTVYRGIITSEAVHTKTGGIDFGNALYNDHHYHYGYIVTAAAMLLYLEAQVKRSAATLASREAMIFQDRLIKYIETLVRDVANPNAHDAYFPRFRYFSWFNGHSYSHGIVPLDDGKDEESTSEEVNFFYGLALFADATQNTRLKQLAKLILAINIHAIQTYILLEDENSGIHPMQYAKHMVTGIFFDNKCDYNTWFSPNRECIHGIQMIPVSPINDVLRSPAFVEKEWQTILKPLPCVADWEAKNQPWTSLLFSNAAILDADKACEVLSKCNMDDGLSRSWALYMAATKKTVKPEA